MKIPLTKACLIVSALLSLALTACGKAPADSNDAIAGTYVITVTQERVFELGGNQVLAALIGGADFWQLELTLDGTARISAKNDLGLRVEEEGPYHLSGDEIVFEPQTGESACHLPGAIGTYRWEIDNGQLILTVVDDHCDRRYLYIAGPWTKQP